MSDKEKPKPEKSENAEAKSDSTKTVDEKQKSVTKTQEKPKPAAKTEEKPKTATKTDEKPKPVAKTQEKPKPAAKTEEKPKPVAKTQEKPKPVAKTEEKKVKPAPQSTKPANPKITEEKAVEIEDELKGDEQITVMITALQAESDVMRYSAVENLVEIGKVAIPKLCEALSHEYWTVKFGAAEILGKIGDDSAIPGLLKYTKDKDPDFRAKIAAAMGEIKSTKAVKALLEMLFDEHDETREQAAKALGLIKDKSAVSALMKAINDKDPHVRAEVAAAMGHIGDKATTNRLIQALKDQNEYVKRSVVLALGELNDPEAIVPLIKTMVRDPSMKPDIKLKAIDSIQSFPEEQIVQQIKKSATKDENEQVQLMDDLTTQCPEMKTVIKHKEEIRTRLVTDYQRMLRRKTSEINSVVAFVKASFNRLTLADKSIVDMIRASIPRNIKTLEEVDLEALKRYGWIYKDLYFDLTKTEEAYKEGSSAIKELENVLKNKYPEDI